MRKLVAIVIMVVLSHTTFAQEVVKLPYNTMSVYENGEFKREYKVNTVVESRDVDNTVTFITGGVEEMKLTLVENRGILVTEGGIEYLELLLLEKETNLVFTMLVTKKEVFLRGHDIFLVFFNKTDRWQRM